MQGSTVSTDRSSAGATLGGRPGAFAAEHQQTEFLRILPKDRFDTFVLLPLLPDEEHQAYMKRVLSQFPPGKLREKNAGAWSFSEAPLSDLKYLFAHL